MTYAIQSAQGRYLGKKVIPGQHSAEVSVEKGELLRLEGDRRGMRVQALEGRLWLTQNGDNQDVILEQGQTYRVNRRGLVLIQGMPSGRVRLFTDIRKDLI